MQAYFELLNSTVAANQFNNYRLYTVSNSPFQDSLSSGSSSLYWGPTNTGNCFSQYISTTDLLAFGHPGQQTISSSWANGTAYDIYVQLTSATAVSFLIAAWSSPTTPPTGRTINGGGQLCDSTGNYVYVGSIYYTGSAFFDYPGLRAVYNKYNQMSKALLAADGNSGSNWQCRTATAEIANAANGRTYTSWGLAVIGVMQGEQHGAITLTNFQACNVGSTAATFYAFIGQNPTSSSIGTNIAQNGVYLPAEGVAAATMGWSGSLLGFNSFCRAEFTVLGATVNFDQAPASGMYGTALC
jgi:hypothetical protein